jgi:hypothetical protein
MKKNYSTKVFTFLIMTLSILSIGCGDSAEKYNVGIKSVLIDLDGNLGSNTLQSLAEGGVTLPKIKLKINGVEHKIKLEGGIVTLPLDLQIGDAYGIALVKKDYVFALNNEVFFNQALPYGMSSANYDLHCELDDAEGVVSEKLKDALLICTASLQELPIVYEPMTND